MKQIKKISGEYIAQEDIKTGDLVEVISEDCQKKEMIINVGDGQMPYYAADVFMTCTGKVIVLKRDGIGGTIIN